jgi:hypothetical protein
MSDPYYVLNRNEGVDTLHKDPRESCNVDDVEGRETIDAETADALLALGDTRRCSHCYLEQEEPSHG